MTRECVLCGSSPTTREHVLPCWLRKYLGRDTLRLYRSGTAGGGKPPQFREWKAPAATRKVPILCEGCNTRWGSELENEAKPVVLPMIRGYPKRLSKSSQETAALWAVKTSMLHDRVGPRASWIIPVPDLHYLRQHNEPPPDTFVWLSAYGGSKYISSHVSFPFPYFNPPKERKLPRGWASTFVVGSLVMQMVSAQGADERAVQVMRETRDMNIPIWPSIGGRRAWPPKEVKDDLMLEAVMYPEGKAPS